MLTDFWQDVTAFGSLAFALFAIAIAFGLGGKEQAAEILREVRSKIQRQDKKKNRCNSFLPAARGREFCIRGLQAIEPRQNIDSTKLMWYDFYSTG